VVAGKGGAAGAASGLALAGAGLRARGGGPAGASGERLGRRAYEGGREQSRVGQERSLESGLLLPFALRLRDGPNRRQRRCHFRDTVVPFPTRADQAGGKCW
jgi:hypothetical protein